MKTKPWLLLLLVIGPMLLAACLLVACASGSAGPNENCAESYNDDETILARICTDKVVYDFGEPVYITFTLTSISDHQPLALDGDDGPALDIRVRGEHWSDGQELTPELTHVTLEPGESRTLNWVWPTPQTDLEALKHDALPDAPTLGISARGIVARRPGAPEGVIKASVAYRVP